MFLDLLQHAVALILDSQVPSTIGVVHSQVALSRQNHASTSRSILLHQRLVRFHLLCVLVPLSSCCTFSRNSLTDEFSMSNFVSVSSYGVPLMLCMICGLRVISYGNPEHVPWDAQQWFGEQPIAGKSAERVAIGYVI